MSVESDGYLPVVVDRIKLIRLLLEGSPESSFALQVVAVLDEHRELIREGGWRKLIDLVESQVAGPLEALEAKTDRP